jgi:hypothetical protein
MSPPDHRTCRARGRGGPRRLWRGGTPGIHSGVPQLWDRRASRHSAVGHCRGPYTTQGSRRAIVRRRGRVNEGVPEQGPERLPGREKRLSPRRASKRSLLLLGRTEVHLRPLQYQVSGHSPELLPPWAERLRSGSEVGTDHQIILIKKPLVDAETKLVAMRTKYGYRRIIQGSPLIDG